MRKNTVIKGLAGAAAMAGASQAYGAVVNVTLPANVVGAAPTTSSTITAANTRNIDLNGDGVRDISVRFRDFTATGGTVLQSFFYGGTSTSPGAPVGYYIAATHNQTYAFSLKTSYVIGGDSSFYQTAGYLGHIVTNYKGKNYGFTAYLGQAGVAETIGFRFTAGTDQIDYGYLQLETDPYVSATNPGGIRFISLAYENTGAAITVPAIPAAVPEPGSLAALALGAASCVGLGLKRRRAAAKAE